jgi:leucyl aminopeptidase (aminopeptidase T)
VPCSPGLQQIDSYAEVLGQVQVQVQEQEHVQVQVQVQVQVLP